MLASTRRSERKARLRSVCCNFMIVRCVYVERGGVGDCMYGGQYQAFIPAGESWVIQICGEGAERRGFRKS